MAEKVQNDEERNRRIEIVGKTFLETGLSTRKLAKYISCEPQFNFKISNATVCDYIKRYSIIHHDKMEQINSLIEANLGSSIKNEKVVKRVFEAYSLLEKKYRIEDISHILKTDYWVIYYDINIRLKKLNKELYESAKIILERNARSHDVINREEI